MRSEHPPSYSQSHDPSTLNLPSAPTTELPSVHHERTLPPLPAVRLEPIAAAEPAPFVWPSSNPLTAYYQPGPSQLSPKNKSMDSPGGMDIDTPDSRGRRGGSVLSIDDPDVRIAAEALGDLRAGMKNLHSFPVTPFSSSNLETQTSYNHLLNNTTRSHRHRNQAHKIPNPSSHSSQPLTL